MSMSGYNATAGLHDEAKIETIQQMSDYMYYSLDQWGRANAASPVPQCHSAVDCLGIDYASDKCCGGIAITEIMGREDYYIYRCLDRGLVGW